MSREPTDPKDRPQPSQNTPSITGVFLPSSTPPLKQGDLSAIFGSEVELPPATPLLEQDRAVDSVFLIHSGLVKLVYLNDEGSQVTVGLRSTGWHAGATSVIARMVSVYSVQTLTRCSISRAPASEFLQELERSDAFASHVFRELCKESLYQAQSYGQAMSANAEKRLLNLLQERSGNGGGTAGANPLRQMTQGELAQVLAITPEHLSRLLRKVGRTSSRGDRGSKKRAVF
jgi:CRP-like cAMP-binding protein